MKSKARSVKPKKKLSEFGEKNRANNSMTCTFIVVSVSILVAVAISWYSMATATTLKESDKQIACDESNGFCHVGQLSNRKSEIKISKYANPEGKAPEVDLQRCDDRHDDCVAFMSQGECKKNPGWMIVNCAKSCRSCHLLDPKVRCQRERLNISLTPAYPPGGMDAMFRQLVEKHHVDMNVTILSSSPWVVTFDNFLTDAEVDALISTNINTLERSTDTGYMNEYGEAGRVLSQGRTSSNSWCRGDCETHPDVVQLTDKIEVILGVARENYESFQLLQYELGQRYTTHHDMSADDNRLACGPRILTFFLYLSDVEEGGETAFPLLDISVKPKKGKALLWPSTMSDDPEIQDSRTMHEARPVLKGVKYAANAWIHLYNYQVPNLWGCTGSFD